MFSSFNRKVFAVRNIHYPVNTSNDRFHTDAVVPSSDICRTQAVLPPIVVITVSGDHYSETVSPPSDHYGTTKVALTA